MDKIQQEFETWAKTTSLKNFLFWHPSDKQYEVHAVQMAFEGWKASRSALCVKLPKTPGFSASDEPDLAYEEGIDDMKDILESMGVTCK